MTRDDEDAEALARRAVRRERRRRRAERVASLTMDVDALRDQIQQLSLQRALMVSRPRALAASLVSPDGSSVVKIERLFRVINHGFRSEDGLTQAFMEMLTGDSVLFDRFSYHTRVFASTRCEMNALRVVEIERDAGDGEDDDGIDAAGTEYGEDTTPVTVIHVDSICHGAFTMTSLHAVWPAVLHDPGLTQLLLDRAMAKPVASTFVFNRAGRVVDFTITSDYHAALARALDGDAGRATRIMHGEMEPSMHQVHQLDEFKDNVEEVSDPPETPTAEQPTTGSIDTS